MCRFHARVASSWRGRGASPRLMVRTPELLQIRTGYHSPQELHIVLDLGSRDVQVTGVQPGPRQLRIHLRAK